MRARRGFARHFMLLGATFAIGLLVGAAAVSVRTSPAPPVEFVAADSPPAAFEVTLTEEPPRLASGWVEYRAVDYRGRTVRGALRHRTFTRCDFRGADLRRVDFTGSVFSGCNLRGTQLDGTDLTGVLYNSGTEWPAEFNPEARGARRDEYPDRPGQPTQGAGP